MYGNYSRRRARDGARGRANTDGMLGHRKPVGGGDAHGSTAVLLKPVKSG